MLLIHEGTGIRWIKFSLILFSVGLVITGMSLIIIGTTINSIYEEFSSFLSNAYFSPATLLVSIGFIIFGIACIGCFGAISESTSIIMAFGGLLGMISIIQLCAGLSNNILMTDMDKEVVYNLNKTLLSYSNNENSQKVIDNLQQELRCCGLSGSRDWQLLYGIDNIPKSCCAVEINGRCEIMYSSGCHAILEAIILESSKILTVSAYLLGFSEVFGMLFSFYLARLLKAQKLAREYRQWAIRSQLLNTVAYDPYSFDFKAPHPHFGITQYKN